MQAIKSSLSVPSYLYSHKYIKEWAEFHRNNVQLIHKIIEKLEYKLATGKRYASVKTIIGELRTSDPTIVGEEYKINDKYTSIYAHMICHNFPKYKKIIKLKKLKS